MFISRIKKIWHADFEGLIKNPLFYFGLTALALFMLVCNSAGTYASSVCLTDSRAVFLNSFLNKQDNQNTDSLFCSQGDKIALETPDLKLAESNTLFGMSPTSIVTAKVLGDAFGSNQNKKDITDYIVQPGDTLQSVASANNISVNTLMWANGLSLSSPLKTGDSLTILPVDGLLYAVKSGDTVGAIAQKYGANPDDIISYNSLANQDDVYVGDILIVPGGVMPKTAAPSSSLNSINKIPTAAGYFIFPAEGTITQGLHFFNAIDLANKCGTPIYAAASGVVQRAVFNNSWNLGMGNYVTILHPNGTVTYYGHFEYVGVKPGQAVSVGDRLGLMGRTGNATGCHVHFQVEGATNPLAKYPVGSKIHY